jgi:hypothetical protein
MDEMQKQLNQMVRFVKEELKRNAEADDNKTPGLVKAPAANLVRFAQSMRERSSREKR